MAQEVNAPHREQHPEDDDWFDLRSLAQVEAWVAPGPRARADATGQRAGSPKLGTPPPSGRGPGFLEAYGPLVYFALLALIPMASGVLLLTAPSEPTLEEPTAEEWASMLNAPPAPNPSDRSAAPPGQAPAVLQVESDPDGAFVYLDGALGGVTPYQADAVEAGWRTVTLERSGYGTRDTLLRLDPGAIAALSFVLVPLGEQATVPLEPSSGVESASTEPPSAERPNMDAALPREVGELQVDARPDRAVVRINGEAVGRTPMVLRDLAAGAHDVTLALPGYAPQTLHVDVAPGRKAVVSADLVALDGTLSVLVRPWGSVYVDGTLLARDTDLRRSIDVAAGPHVVRVVHPVLGVQERRVEVRAGETTSVVFDLL